MPRGGRSSSATPHRRRIRPGHDASARTGALRRYTLAFNALCVALALWLTCRERLDGLTGFLIALPVTAGLAIVALSNGRVALTTLRLDRPTVAGLIVPATLVALRAILTTELRDGWALAAVGLAAGLVAFTGLRLRRPRPTQQTTDGQTFWTLRREALQLRFAAASAVAVITFGLCVFADVAFDSSAPSEVPATVLYKWRSRAGLKLSLSGAGARLLPSASASQALYDGVAKGDRICVRRHPGGLGAPWLDVAACSNP